VDFGLAHQLLFILPVRNRGGKKMVKKRVIDEKEISDGNEEMAITSKLRYFRNLVQNSQIQNEWIIRYYNQLVMSCNGEPSKTRVEKEASTYIYQYRPQFYAKAIRMGWLGR